MDTIISTSHSNHLSLTLAQIQALRNRSREALQHENGLHSLDARLQEGALYHLQQILKYDIEQRCAELEGEAPLETVRLGDDHLRMLYDRYKEAVELWTNALGRELERVYDELAEVNVMVMVEGEAESVVSELDINGGGGGGGEVDDGE